MIVPEGKNAPAFDTCTISFELRVSIARACPNACTRQRVLATITSIRSAIFLARIDIQTLPRKQIANSGPTTTSNLYRPGVPDMVIQRILRHANVSTTATYYIKTAADDVWNAMAKLEHHIAESAPAQGDTNGTLESVLVPGPSAVQ
jgi:hypothetical protein